MLMHQINARFMHKRKTLNVQQLNMQDLKIRHGLIIGMRCINEFFRVELNKCEELTYI